MRKNGHTNMRSVSVKPKLNLLNTTNITVYVYRGVRLYNTPRIGKTRVGGARVLGNKQGSSRLK